MTTSKSMPVYEPQLPIGTLDDFLNETERLIDNIVGPWAQILFALNDRSFLDQAWAELKNNLSAIKTSLATAAAPTLQAAGLTGVQLSSKLTWVSNAWSNFSNNGTVKLLRMLLKWINLVLGSIAKALPGYESLKEMKESIELLLA